MFEDIYRPPKWAGVSPDPKSPEADITFTSKQVQSSGMTLLLRVSDDTWPINYGREPNFPQELKAKQDVPQWDDKPQSLTTSRLSLCLDLATDIAGVISILPFFLLAATVMFVHGRPLTAYRFSTLEQATKLVCTFSSCYSMCERAILTDYRASTLFTAVSAAIVGKATTRYAVWQLERGATIGELEQLMQSRTVSGTFVTQMRLRSFSSLGLMFVSVWVLSPIGSQSPLRVLGTDTNTTISQYHISYVDTWSNDAFTEAAVMSYILQSLRLVYISSLLGPPSTKNGSADLWGNVKIPYLSRLGDAKSNEWLEVPKITDSASIYSSLIGIPIADLSSGNTSTFLETTYIGLECSNPQKSSKVDVPYKANPSNGTFRAFNADYQQGDILDPTWFIALDVFVDRSYDPAG
ncbi:hypothetical protein MMC06_005442, partial [Schaereria dolodes]|nr:hypothetical protein [Schaereria dolodes]